MSDIEPIEDDDDGEGFIVLLLAAFGSALQRKGKR
jgi:hypothetical protein